MAIETPRWVRDAVFYQIFPDRFAASERVAKPGPLEPWDAPPSVHGFKGGDLIGIVERLDHLQALGVDAIYLNPIFSSASNHRYHTFDYMAVDPLLGGDGALRELLDACHARGMRVILDGVFNHASRGFWPFHHVMEAGRHSPYVNWFHFDRAALDEGRQVRAYPDEPLRDALDVSTLGEERRLGAQSLETLGYRAWWDLPALPKLNTDDPHVREYLFGVAEHWLRFGTNGWRLDVPLEIDDVAFWQEFRGRVKAVNPEAYIVAEIWQERPEHLQGDQYDAYMNYPLAEAILSFVGGEHLDLRVCSQHFELGSNIRREDGATFGRRLEHVLSTYDPAVTAVQLNLLGSHDTPRLRTMVGGDLAAVRLATLAQMTLPGAPCLYYGDEIGLQGEMDPGCRAAFPWDHPDAWDHDLLAFVSGAVALRRAHPVLRAEGTFRVVAAAGEACAYVRSDPADPGGAAIVVALNAGEAPQRLMLELFELDGRTLVPVRWAGWPAIGDNVGVVTVSGGRADVDLPARDGLVLRAT